MNYGLYGGLKLRHPDQWHSNRLLLLNGQLWQGCLLFPYLFVLCADVLSRALRAAAQEVELETYKPAPGGQLLSHLLFTYDCLLLGRASVIMLSALLLLLSHTIKFFASL